MGILTEEMKRVVTDIQLCYAATVTPDRRLLGQALNIAA